MSKGYGARTEAETKAALATVAKAEKAGIRTVQLQFVDLHGITKSVQIPIHMMPNAIKHGTWFDGSSVEGFTRIGVFATRDIPSRTRIDSRSSDRR
jgi:glutamine synthetase